MFSSVFRLNFRMKFSSIPYAVAMRRRGSQYKLLGPGGPKTGLGPDYVAYVPFSLTVVSLVSITQIKPFTRSPSHSAPYSRSLLFNVNIFRRYALARGSNQPWAALPVGATSPAHESYMADNVNTIRHSAQIMKLLIVRERTIPTERPPPVGEVSANFCG
jgi:hypothetical protein